MFIAFRAEHKLDTFHIELEYRNVGVWEEGKTRIHGEKTSQSKDGNQQQTQPSYDTESGNRTRATFVGGAECSHHYAIPALDIVKPTYCLEIKQTLLALVISYVFKGEGHSKMALFLRWSIER